MSPEVKRPDMDTHGSVVEFYGTLLDYSDLDRLLIWEEAWAYINQMGFSPRDAFAHPDVFCQSPSAVRYYRGMALISLEDMSEVAVAVDEWEHVNTTAEPTPEDALSVARACNYVNSGIITNIDGWTPDDGIRNIFASMDIFLDGSMEPWEIAEKLIQNKLPE